MWELVELNVPDFVGAAWPDMNQIVGADNACSLAR